MRPKAFRTLAVIVGNFWTFFSQVDCLVVILVAQMRENIYEIRLIFFPFIGPTGGISGGANKNNDKDKKDNTFFLPVDRLVVILVAQVFNGCLLPFFSICLLLCINDEQFMGRCESLSRSPCQHCHLFQVPSEGLAQHLPCDWSHNHPPARQQRHRAEGEKDLPKTN